MTGRLIGVGTGPGDPELMTLKAVRALREAGVIAWFAKRGNASNARAIAAAHFPPGVNELPLAYPVTTEIARHEATYRTAIAAFYDESAARVAEQLDAGRTVAVLSEGDPLFYGSWMHLHVRLAHCYPTEVVPGITAMSGAWSALGMPITQGDDVLTVLPGILDEDVLARRIAETNACVIMKIGRNLKKVRSALAAAGRLDDAFYVERATMPAMKTARLKDRADDDAPYFSIVLVPGWSGRP